MSFLVALFDKFGKEVDKKAYMVFVAIGFILIYFKGNKEEFDKIVVAIGYGFIIAGFITGVATNLISIKLEVYEHIIKQYHNLAESNSGVLGGERQYINELRGFDTISNKKTSSLSNTNNQKPTPID